MAHPFVSFASDSGVLSFGDGVPHPRGYGNNARVLGTYVRERGVLSLEQAIRKMTGLPAEHFRIANRGLVRPGTAADLVIFDPARVGDAATYEQPHQYATGFAFVIVNGKIVVEDGRQTSERPGQVIAKSLLQRGQGMKP
jgi:N-acyl-D-amino-acid deacylase